MLEEWNKYKMFYNQSHTDIDNELTKNRINYKKYYDNVKYYLKKVDNFCAFTICFGFVLILIRIVNPKCEELEFLSFLIIFFIIISV